MFVPDRPDDASARIEDPRNCGAQAHGVRHRRRRADHCVLTEDVAFRVILDRECAGKMA